MTLVRYRLSPCVAALLILSCESLLLGATNRAFASDPGQPLGPEDWVFSEPGMWAEYAYPFAGGGDPQRNDEVFDPSGGATLELIDCSSTERRILDAAGRMLVMELARDVAVCGDENLREIRLTAVAKNGVATTVGYLRERCVDPQSGTGSFPRRDVASLLCEGGQYDPTGGELLLLAFVQQVGFNPKDYLAQRAVFRIHGLPNNFDILTTFTPDTSALTWSAPFMPMGLSARAADSYDVFRGDLNEMHTSGTAAFASMDSVACAVSPTSMPEVGERFVVPLPVMQTSAEYYVKLDEASTPCSRRWCTQEP